MPVGVELPVPPFTATVTINDCAVVTVEEPAVRVTVGMLFCAVNPIVPEVLGL